MSTILLNGQRVVTAQMTTGRYGAPVADLALATSSAIPVKSTLQIGNLAVQGTAFRMASFAGARSIRFVGGKNNGWGREIKAAGYSHEAGVKLSTVLQDAARDAGEALQLASDRVIGKFFVRERAPAERVLHLLVPRQWWVDPSGVTQVGPRASTLITSSFTVINWSGGRGRFEIATEAYEDWLPGRRFSAPTVAGTQTISAVQLTADNDGKLRLVVLTGADTSDDRLLDSLRAIVRAEQPTMTYAGVWEYKIFSATSSTVDATPTDSRMPPLTNVPMTPGLLAEGVTPAPDTLCRIQFVNQDPTRPEATHILGKPLTSSIDATGTLKLGAGIKPAAAAGDFAGPFPIVPTQVKVLI